MLPYQKEWVCTFLLTKCCCKYAPNELKYSLCCSSAGFRRSFRLWRRTSYRKRRQSCTSCSPSSNALYTPYEEVALYQRAPQESHRLIILVGAREKKVRTFNTYILESMNLIPSSVISSRVQVLQELELMNWGRDSSNWTLPPSREPYLVCLLCTFNTAQTLKCTVVSVNRR